MAESAPALPAPFRDPRTFVKHAYEEKTVNLGEVSMNYAGTGSPGSPALLLIPGQTESWWGYQDAMALLEKDFHVFAVDLRGQGRRHLDAAPRMRCMPPIRHASRKSSPIGRSGCRRENLESGLISTQPNAD